MTIAAGWWNAPTQVLALGQVDAGLAADRGVDLGDERRRDVDRSARRAGTSAARNPAGVAERAAADRHERLAPFDAQACQLARPPPRSPASRLASSPCGSSTSRPASRRRRAPAASAVPDRGPRAGLRDEDRAPRPEPPQRVADGRRGDPLADARARRSASSAREQRRAAARGHRATQRLDRRRPRDADLRRRRSRGCGRGVEPLARRGQVAHRRDRVAARRSAAGRSASGGVAGRGPPGGRRARPASRPRYSAQRLRGSTTAPPPVAIDPAQRRSTGRAAPRAATAARSQRPEGGLAFLREDLRDRAARSSRLDLLVEVDERRAVALRQALARRRSCRSRAARRARGPSAVSRPRRSRPRRCRSGGMAATARRAPRRPATGASGAVGRCAPGSARRLSRDLGHRVAAELLEHERRRA